MKYNIDRRLLSVLLLITIFVQLFGSLILVNMDFNGNLNRDDSPQKIMHVGSAGGDIFYADSNGYIRTWLFTGTFNEPANWSQYPTINGSQVIPPDETVYYTYGDYVQANGSMAGSDGSKRWDSVQSQTSEMDISQLYPSRYSSNVSAYFIVYVYFPEDYPEVFIFGGSSNGFAIYFNASRIYYNHTIHPYYKNSEHVSLGPVNKGWHSLMVLSETTEGATDWKFSLGFSLQESHYEPIEGLCFGLDYKKDVPEHYIFLFSEKPSGDTLSNFTDIGGVITSGPWNLTDGFAGIINESLIEYFRSRISQTFEVYADPIINAQMNEIHYQLETYPYVIGENLSVGGYLGDNNTSMAFLDTGIDPGHILFNPNIYGGSYGDANFSKKIVGWHDFLGSESQPIDLSGHGTSLAAVAVGGGSSLLATNRSGNTYFFTLGGNYSHFDLFYPNHVLPGTYRIKTGSFNISLIGSALAINATISAWNGGPIPDTYSFEIYVNGSLVYETDSLDFTYNVTNGFTGVYDLYFAYNKNLEDLPKFTLIINGSFIPASPLGDFANFTGIAPESKIVSIRILNTTGAGYASKLIDGLEWLYYNNGKYHIAVATLSIAAWNIESEISSLISSIMDKVIDNGTMIILAAGNKGPGNNVFNELAKNSKAIVVGAINDRDQLTYYSSQGIQLDNGNYKPDIVAPGGSMLNGHLGILTAETNYPDNGSDETVLNDITFITGTSVSAAITAGVMATLIESVGGYSSLNLTDSQDLLKLKSVLLMTASELNTGREDNPNTADIDESQYGPSLNRGDPDVHEGYGRINPRAAIEALTTGIALNESINGILYASDTDAYGRHVFAGNITFKKDTVYTISLIPENTLDADIYIYSSIPDEFGNPRILSKSTNPGKGQEESYNYNFINETQTVYITVKAISGSGSFTLTITEANITESPELNNFYLETDSNYNDSLDYFKIYVNYSQPENFAPNYIYFSTNHSNYANYTMQKVSTSDANYTDGCLYYIEYKFGAPGDYGIRFFTRVGNFTYNYTDTGGTDFIIHVNPIHNYLDIDDDFSYENNFDSLSQTDLWDYSPQVQNIKYNGETVSVYMGWDWIEVLNIYENRATSATDPSWGALYFGVTGEVGVPHTPLVYDNEPYYSYAGITGTYDVVSPTVYINESLPQSIVPAVKLGMRVSVGAGDTFSIQINANRTGWAELQSFTNTQTDWTLLTFNLDEYKGNYIQIRIRADITGIPQQYDKGFMLDYFSLFNDNNTNENCPELLHAQDSGYNNLPYVSSDNPSGLNTKYDLYTFSVAYRDQDGNYPLFVYLEIDNKNYSMYNKYGRWNPSPGQFQYSMVFEIKIPLYNVSNTSFRFHAFDGKFYSTADPGEKIGFDPVPEDDILHTPIDTYGQWDDIADNVLVVGTPPNMPGNVWLESTESWHKVSTDGSEIKRGMWYCGKGDYMGYDYDWDTSLILPLMILNGSHEIFMDFDHQLILADQEQSGDYGQILISDDNGTTWDLLQTFDQQTSGFNHVQLKLNAYMNEMVLLRFRFVSDNVGFQSIPNSGWTIANITIDINRTKDYDKPIISFNFEDGARVGGIINVSIRIEDNQIDPIPAEQIVVYLDTELLNVSKYYDPQTGTINFTIDTWQYDNGETIEIAVIVHDNAGNRASGKVFLQVANSYRNWELTLIILIPLLVVFGIAYQIVKTYRIRKLYARGDYVPKPSIRDRLQQRKFEKERDREETELILDIFNQNPELQKWEKAQPYYLFCKTCKSWYKSEDFEIYCPECLNDSLYIAKYCPVCHKWYYFETPGKHYCPKCKIQLLKDFENAKQKIIEWQNENGNENAPEGDQ